jgi:hypothetical protein
MITAIPDIEHHSRGIKSSTEFHVASTAKLMDMLSNALYSNKIRAVIRELSTNAIDANVKAGHSKPFQVHLPTHNKLLFSIRDFGTGLSEHNMEKLYTTYGASDKTDSNLFVGCMGIGSKSPFAYTSSFTATSYFNGKKFVYIAAKDAKGIPTLNKMLVEDTKEPNGLEVSFAVKSHDINDFRNEAVFVYKHFPYYPVFTGNTISTAELKQSDILFSGDRWKLLKSGQPVAVMGHVAYPIDVHHFSDKKGDKYSYSYHRNFYEEILTCAVILDFDIGEIEMDISREKLQYTSETIAAIKKQCDVIKNTIEKKVQDKIDLSKNYYEACKNYYEVVSTTLANLNSLKGHINTTYKGKQIVDSLTMGQFLPFVGREFTKSYSSVRSTIGPTYLQNFRYTSKMRFYILDMEKGGISAARRDMETHGVSHGYLFNPDVDIQTLYDYIGCDKDDGLVVYLSTVPKPPKEEREKKKYHKILRYSSNRSWLEEEVDEEDGGFYIEIHRNKPLYNGMEINLDDIKNYCNRFGITIPTDIYGVKKVAVDKIKGMSEWKNVVDHIKELVEQYIKTKKVDDVYAASEVTSDYDFQRLGYFMKLPVGTIPADSSFKRVHDYLTNLSTISNTNTILKEKHYFDRLVSILNVTFIASKNKFRETMKQFYGFYPLCKYMDYSKVMEDTKGTLPKPLVEYITERDNALKAEGKKVQI